MAILYFSKFYNFFPKRVTGGLFGYYGIVSKEEIIIIIIRTSSQ